jgi:hypothetical protein
MAEPTAPSRRRDQQALIDAIAAEELVLTRLTEEERDARARLAALRAELNALDQQSRIPPLRPRGTHAPAPHSAADKVALFRRLFRGREDVFPTRFTSKKTGKAGYAPACRNKFCPGVCDLPRIKCGECPNQAFVPVDDGAVLAHLQGRHVMGIYPLLADDTCWFLAVDFDKGTWADDVIAFIETARRIGLPIAVERSRSGNGAHVWFFFSAPVAASVARKMGCHLITETMSRRHQLGMDSYDRLFPSQDVGVFVAPPGVGKTVVGIALIAARRCATLVLVHRRPLLDQWLAQLAAFLGIDEKTIGRIGGGKRRASGRLDVAMIQSLVHRGTVDDLVAGYSQVIVDECHHVPAVSF